VDVLQALPFLLRNDDESSNNSEGRPSFQILQDSLSQELPIYFYAFDLLNRNGELLVNLPLSRRCKLLENLLAAPKDPVRLSPLLEAPSGEVLEAVRKLGLEGVVGKRTDSIYEPGERSGAWIKLRTNMKQEFVIGGYVPGARGFDALLVGVYQHNEPRVVRRLRVDEASAPLPSLSFHHPASPAQPLE
jgi:bifunctional non-homologous end joining protein LigD